MLEAAVLRHSTPPGAGAVGADVGQACEVCKLLKLLARDLHEVTSTEFGVRGKHGHQVGQGVKHRAVGGLEAGRDRVDGGGQVGGAEAVGHGVSPSRRGGAHWQESHWRSSIGSMGTMYSSFGWLALLAWLMGSSALSTHCLSARSSKQGQE